MSTSQVLKGTLAMEWDRTALAQPRGAEVSSPKSQARANLSAFFPMDFLA
jgi:hypothetical protein